MNSSKVIASLLIVGGVLALIYGGFTFTRSTTKAELGPISIDVQDRERVNIPIWAGAAGVGVGALLLLAAARKK